MATKLEKLGVYSKEIPSINSLNPFITWSCKLTRNIRSLNLK